MLKRLKPILVVLLVLSALAVGGFYASRRFYPLELSDFSHRLELWRYGAREFNFAQVHGFEQNHCETALKNPALGECHCIALIHGLGDQALTWRKILLTPAQAWNEPVRLFAFDLPGSGGSAPPGQVQEYRSRKLAHKMIDILQKIRGCPNWLVVGNSFGGWVSAWIALDWEEGVGKLVLVGSAGLKSVKKRRASTFLEPSVDSLKDFQRRAYHRPRDLPDYIWSAVMKRMRKSNSRQVLEAQRDEDFLDEQLSKIRPRTMVFWGNSDRIIPIEDGLLVKSKIPGAIWHLENECGHLPQKECPSALVRALNAVLLL
jgi:pimeloyl-ACP methyl ester carboxylesterase